MPSIQKGPHKHYIDVHNSKKARTFRGVSITIAQWNDRIERTGEAPFRDSESLGPRYFFRNGHCELRPLPYFNLHGDQRLSFRLSNGEKSWTYDEGGGARLFQRTLTWHVLTAHASLACSLSLCKNRVSPIVRHGPTRFSYFGRCLRGNLTGLILHISVKAQLSRF